MDECGRKGGRTRSAGLSRVAPRTGTSDTGCFVTDSLDHGVVEQRVASKGSPGAEARLGLQPGMRTCWCQGTPHRPARGDERQPSEPSISSFTRRLNSMAYSIGSSFVKT